MESERCGDVHLDIPGLKHIRKIIVFSRYTQENISGIFQDSKKIIPQNIHD